MAISVNGGGMREIAYFTYFTYVRIRLVVNVMLTVSAPIETDNIENNDKQNSACTGGRTGDIGNDTIISWRWHNVMVIEACEASARI